MAAVAADLSSASRYIPLRLTAHERMLLQVVDGALDTCEYTDNVDVSRSDYYVVTAYDKQGTIVQELYNFFSILCGISASADFKRAGKRLLIAESISSNAAYFQQCLEIARRYKIQSPDKLRGTYGKLLYIIMDSVSPRITRELGGWSLKLPLQTVHAKLEAAGALALLSDPLVAVATSEIVSRDAAVASENAARKDQAVRALCDKYAGEAIAADDIRLCLCSITDNRSFMRGNRDPVDRLIHYLKSVFSPEVEQPGSSLAICAGRGGSKLSHDHRTQFCFVLQSLLLWREIMTHFNKLWYLTEEDLLDDRNGYRLCNTGQGLQRCQSAPRVGRAMGEILRRVQSQVGRWVGLSVVHLGDRDVPNALIFIDKYTQVPRIVRPLVATLDKIDGLMEQANTRAYIEGNFGTPAALKKAILVDYFRHGFDGSGDDGGSCIDGRLTSNWNWCSKLEKKSFWPVFLLTDFRGFDGEFKG